MTGKNPREKSEVKAKSEAGFSEPAAKNASQEMVSEFEEEAGVSGFQEPDPSGEYSEDAAAAEAQKAALSVPQNLLDIQAAIEKQLAGNAASGAARAADAYEGGGNFVGVGIGYGEPHQASGTPTLSTGVAPGELAVNVYVAEMTSIDEVKSVIVESLGVSAASDDGVPINVIQTGIIDAQPHRFRLRPAPGGISVGHYKITAGTIGCLCVGNHAPRNSRLMVLSNNHVLANSNSAVFGDCICQPGPADGGKCPADQIAILERFVPINFSGGANYVDCATGWCWPERVRRELVYRSGGGLAFFRISAAVGVPALGMIVGKSGRTTQLTVGRVTGLGVSVNVNYGGGKVALFRDQIAIQSVNANPFSAGGDSGSSIWTWDSLRRPVGLLFAGGGGVTFANRMTRVIAALDVHLYT